MANTFQRLVNNAVTTVASAMTAVQTTLEVGDAARFPTSGDFHVLVGTETMLVTAVSGTTFTVVRGVDGTGAATHSIGELVKGIVSKNQLETFFGEVGVRAQVEGDPTDLRRFTVLDPATRLRARVSDFTWVNQGTATAQDIGSTILMTSDVGSAADNLQTLVIAAPSAPFNMRCAMTFHSVRGAAGISTAPYPQAGFHFRESSTGKIMGIRALPRTPTAGSEERWNVQVKKMTNATTFSASMVHTGWSYGDGPIWFRIEDDNVDLIFYTGVNGTDWIEVFRETRTTFMATGPDQVGFGINMAEGTAAGSLPYKGYMEVLHFSEQDD